MLAVNALFRLRAAQGVPGLASKYGAGRLELACAKAIAAGDPTYRTIKGVLAAGAGSRPRPASGRRRRGGGVPARPGRRLFENVVAMPYQIRTLRHQTSDDHGGSDEPGAGVSA